MAFDFTNQWVYIYSVITIGIIVILVYGIKLFLTFKHKPNIPLASAELPSEKELKSMLKELEDSKKVKEKVKKVELNIVAEKKVKKEVKKPEEIKDTEIKKFKLNPFKISWDFIRTWYLDKYHAGKVVLINMELSNGFHRLFLVKMDKDEGFIFRGKKYVLDDDSKYYNLDTKLYTFDFHEQIALPFKRKIPVTEIKKELESTDGIDIAYAMNPSTLQRFMTAKIAEGVMKGTQLDEFMKKLQMFLIVTMVAVLAHLALFLYASGILQNLKVPGIVG